MTLLVGPWQQYLKKLHMQERAVEEVKLAIKPFYQRRDINKDEYKEILRKAVQKVGATKTLEALLNIWKYHDFFIFFRVAAIRCATARAARSIR